MYVAYSTLLGLALILGLPYWLFEMSGHGKYRKGLGQRLGFVPARFLRSVQRSIWVHAVSVGEVLAVSKVVERLRAQYPQRRIVISTTTDTGQKLAAKRFGAENVFYFPLDFSFAARRWMNALRPELIVVAETEFWPNFLRVARESGARVAIVNARISDRSLPGYRRWRRFLKRILAGVDLFLAQTPEDVRRLIEIGAPPEGVQLSGNLKYDVAPPGAPEIVDHLRKALRNTQAGPVLLCGSTVEGEELLLVGAFKNILASHASAVMLLAPRHPERFDAVASILEDLNVKFWRRSLWDGGPLNGGVLLVDTIGELASLYALADVAFVGGSLVPRGGHSILEPAQHGVAVVVGNHTENFRDIVGLFQSRDAVRVVGPAELPLVLMGLLADPEERAALGRRAIETLESQKGATEFTLRNLNSLLADAASEVRHD
jgi:3-deoxy-D-manno-octulosonic-acid transferase